MWPQPLGGTVHVPRHPPRPLESLVGSLTSVLTPFITPDTAVATYRLPQSTTLPLFFAISRLRAIPVLLNDRYTLSDVSRALTTLPCAALLTTALPPAHTRTVHDAVPLILTLPTQSPFHFPVTASYSPTLTAHPPHSLPSSTAAIFFTSGTSATPKPVPLTYRNLSSQSLCKIAHLPIPPSTIYLHLAPLFHLAGFSSTLAVVLANADHVFPQHLHPSNPRHAAQLLKHFRDYAVTLIVAVPATLRLLLDAAHHSVPTVKTVLYGGSAASDVLLRDIRATFPSAEVLAAYGMTETASSLTVARGTGPSLPLPHVRLAILQNDGRIVSSGHGEVLTRGPHVFPGYYGLPNHGFLRGWFRTGDIGRLTDGLTLHGRIVDMIKSGGEKVYAGEVESVLMRHSAVREAAVVGLPDRVLGEAVAACVVLVGGDGQGVLKALRGFCREGLATFKCPRWIMATEELPRNATGKVVKTRVKQILESRLRPRAML